MSSVSNYLLKVGEIDLKRMSLLGSIYEPFNQAFLLKHGLKSGMKIADIACGPGNTSLFLSKLVGPSGRVVAIDNSHEQLSILEKKIENEKINNIDILNRNLLELDQISEKFDLIFCRFILVHLQAPLEALQIFKSLLKPGGLLFTAEPDNQSWYCFPDNELIHTEIQALISLGSKKGLDYAIGPKLYGYLRNTSFTNVAAEIAQPVLNQEQKQYFLLRAEANKEIYLQNNLFSESEYNQLVKDLADFVQNDNYLVTGFRMFQVCGRK